MENKMENKKAKSPFLNPIRIVVFSFLAVVFISLGSIIVLGQLTRVIDRSVMEEARKGTITEHMTAPNIINPGEIQERCIIISDPVIARHDYMVPFRTMAEWQAFKANMPPGITRRCCDITFTCSFRPGQPSSCGPFFQEPMCTMLAPGHAVCEYNPGVITHQQDNKQIFPQLANILREKLFIQSAMASPDQFSPSGCCLESTPGKWFCANMPYCQAMIGGTCPINHGYCANFTTPATCDPSYCNSRHANTLCLGNERQACIDPLRGETCIDPPTDVTPTDPIYCWTETVPYARMVCM